MTWREFRAAEAAGGAVHHRPTGTVGRAVVELRARSLYYVQPAEGARVRVHPRDCEPETDGA